MYNLGQYTPRELHRREGLHKENLPLKSMPSRKGEIIWALGIAMLFSGKIVLPPSI